jgi:cytochrome P450
MQFQKNDFDSKPNKKTSEKQAGFHFSDKFLKDVVMSFLIAGRDTTAATLTFCIWVLHHNPGKQSPRYKAWCYLRLVLCADVQTKLLRELDEVFSEQSIQLDYDLVKSKALPYLDGFVKEVIRLFPSVPWNVKYEARLACIHLPFV